MRFDWAKNTVLRLPIPAAPIQSLVDHPMSLEESVRVLADHESTARLSSVRRTKRPTWSSGGIGESGRRVCRPAFRIGGRRASQASGRSSASTCRSLRRVRLRCRCRGPDHRGREEWRRCSRDPGYRRILRCARGEPPPTRAVKSKHSPCSSPSNHRLFVVDRVSSAEGKASGVLPHANGAFTILTHKLYESRLAGSRDAAWQGGPVGPSAASRL